MKFVLIFFLAFLICGCNEVSNPADHLLLANKLSGKWKASAFDGEIHEEWKLNECGWMVQKGNYIEKNDTTYSAITRIEK